MANEKEETIKEENPESKESVEVESPPEIVEKHRLQNEWQLWYFRPDKTKQWTENLLQVTRFDSVEDFWALYNHIELASNLTTGSDYSVFKDNIKPMWEDDRNKKGGRWLFTFNKKMAPPKLIDDMWLEILLSCIGEGFGEDSDQICGCVINVRPKMDKISVWTADHKCTSSIMKIGRILKERTNFNGQITFEAHEDTQVKHGSSARYMHTC